MIDWLVNHFTASLNNTVKIHNVIQNKHFMYITCYYKCLQKEPKAWKLLLLHLEDNQILYKLLTKHFIQIST